MAQQGMSLVRWETSIRMTEPVSYEAFYESHRECEIVMLAQARGFLLGLGTPEPKVEDVCTVLSEAFRNAAEHGNGWAPEKRVLVRMSVHHGGVTLEVLDEGGRDVWRGTVGDGGRLTDRMGEGTHPIHPIMASDLPTRGWGLRLIEALSDSWTLDIHPGRTRIQMHIRLIGEGEPANE